VYEIARLIVTSLVLPPSGPIVVVGFGALVLRQWPRVGRAAILGGAAALWLSALPIVANALVTALGGARPLDMAAAGKADAIVILGGGVRSGAVEFGGDTLGRLTLERVRYGAFLARQTGLPVLVTGGAPEEGVRAEADLMREALQREFGVTVRWADDRARNTRENAERAARLLQAENKRRVVLVMHGFDVKRARAQFAAAGLDVLPAPTQVPLWEGPELADFLPNAGALVTTHYAAYELLAIGRDRLLASLVVSPKVSGRGN
jgi:uncharacterized SAM-binding protein YcdF (DUF218 family)